MTERKSHANATAQLFMDLLNTFETSHGVELIYDNGFVLRIRQHTYPFFYEGSWRLIKED